MHGKMVGRYCELRKDSEQLEANIQALHRSKCIFFCRCARQVSAPSSPVLQTSQLLALRQAAAGQCGACPGIVETGPSIQDGGNLTCTRTCHPPCAPAG